MCSSIILLFSLFQRCYIKFTFRHVKYKCSYQEWIQNCRLCRTKWCCQCVVIWHNGLHITLLSLGRNLSYMVMCSVLPGTLCSDFLWSQSLRQSLYFQHEGKLLSLDFQTEEMGQFLWWMFIHSAGNRAVLVHHCTFNVMVNYYCTDEAQYFRCNSGAKWELSYFQKHYICKIMAIYVVICGETFKLSVLVCSSYFEYPEQQFICWKYRENVTIPMWGLFPCGLHMSFIWAHTEMLSYIRAFYVLCLGLHVEL